VLDAVPNTAVVLDHAAEARGFRHEAFFYGTEAEYLTGTASFVTAGLDTGEPVLVAVSAPRIAALRQALGRRAKQVEFVDMRSVGTNPARIIPVWRTFVGEQGRNGQSVRGIGEPVWAERSPDAMRECHLHEALLNHAFGSANGWLLCPYDTAALAPADVQEAKRTHPYLWEQGMHAGSPEYDAADVASWFAEPLPPPPPGAFVLDFVAADLARLRFSIAQWATDAGLSETKTSDFVLAVSEVAGNSIRYGGGWGTLRFWQNASEVVAEVEDAGRVADPLAGRSRPSTESFTGRGLWLVHQVCDLAELRATANGTVVRMHITK